MAQFRVDSEQIQQSAAAVGSSINAIRDATNGMYANLQQLQSVWTGPAATQFATTAGQWRAAHGYRSTSNFLVCNELNKSHKSQKQKQT